MKYKEDKTQEQRILNLLREKGLQGVYVYEFMAPRPQGLGIAQYNARIFGLREKGYNIKNTTPGHFILIENNTQEETKEIKPSISNELKEKFPYLFE